MAAEAPTESAPLDALAACSIDRWYPVLRRNSVRTTLVPLGDEFLAYLQADGVFVAGGDDDDDGWGDDDADGAAPPPRFPELEAAIDAAVGEYGAVFPKLNWSSPRDASWILGGSCKCTSARDVLLLLKSSDSVAHDLAEGQRLRAAGGDGPNWVLALRKWSELRPEGEFRCFRAGGRLVGACQRDRFSHYPFLEPARGVLLELLRAFQTEHLGALERPADVVWDAYVDAQQKVHLLDVAPFHESTDPILFTWPELRARAAQPAATGSAPPEAAAADDLLRLVPADAAGGVRPSARMYNGWPVDVLQAGGEDLGALIATAQRAAES